MAERIVNAENLLRRMMDLSSTTSTSSLAGVVVAQIVQNVSCLFTFLLAHTGAPFEQLMSKSGLENKSNGKLEQFMNACKIDGLRNSRAKSKTYEAIRNC